MGWEDPKLGKEPTWGSYLHTHLVLDAISYDRTVLGCVNMLTPSLQATSPSTPTSGSVGRCLLKISLRKRPLEGGTSTHDSTRELSWVIPNLDTMMLFPKFGWLRSDFLYLPTDTQADLNAKMKMMSQAGLYVGMNFYRKFIAYIMGAAKIIMEDWGGQLPSPDNPEELKKFTQLLEWNARSSC